MRMLECGTTTSNGSIELVPLVTPTDEFNDRRLGIDPGKFGRMVLSSMAGTKQTLRV
jgi:hypothetical protein